MTMKKQKNLTLLGLIEISIDFSEVVLLSNYPLSIFQIPFRFSRMTAYNFKNRPTMRINTTLTVINKRCKKEVEIWRSMGKLNRV
jgi:hypothetical protein